MKTVKTFAALVAALPLVFACAKAVAPEPQGPPARIRIRVDGVPATKMSASDETSIASVQVFVFNSDGSLADYTTADNALGLSAVVSPGLKNICVLVNAPICRTIASKTALEALRSKLIDNTSDGDGLVMYGTTSTNVTGDCEVAVEVKRFVAKIRLGTVTTLFESAAFSNRNFDIKRVYLTGVAGDIDYGATTAPTQWYNVSGYDPSSVDELIVRDWLEDMYIIRYNSSEVLNFDFYVYPNNFAVRSTKLVLEASLDSEMQRYVVDFANLVSSIERNKVYTIDNLIITHKCPEGTTMTDVDCTITIAAWETGLAPYTETL